MNKLKNNWILWFTIIFVGALALLSAFGIFLNDGIEGFFLGKTDDKRLDVMSSIVVASVSLASALVAIILARTALVYAENEEKREFKGRIEERIKNVQNINNEIINSANELSFVAFETFKNINFMLMNYADKVPKNIEYIEKEFNRNKELLRKFVEAIKQLDSNSLISQHYEINFEKDDIAKTFDINNIAIGMKYKYIDELQWEVIWKSHRTIFDKIQNEDPKIIKWIILSIIFDQASKSYYEHLNIDIRNYGGISLFDTLLKLPNSKSFKTISKELDKEFWNTNSEAAEKIIDILSKETSNGKKFKEEILASKNFLIKHNIFLDFDFFLKMLKGVAIKHKQKEINANVILKALSYLELNSYAKAVFNKMMGEYFIKIEPSTGGQEYINLIDDYEGKDITFDSDAEKFIAEARKHLGNENFCSLR